MNSLIDDAPKELASDLALEKGILYVADTRKGDPVFLSFRGLARLRGGITQIEFVDAKTFYQIYGRNSLRILQESKSGSDSDVEKAVKELLQAAFDERATDIHIATYGSYGLIQFRRFGMLREYSRERAEQLDRMISVIYGKICTDQSHSGFQKMERQDARIADARYLPKSVHGVRVHTEPIVAPASQDGAGTFMALRLLYDQTETRGALEECLTGLGYRKSDTENQRALINRTGLKIIAGPVNSGKSTTLKKTMEAQAQETPEKSFMSLEDPPEGVIHGVKQISILTTNEEASRDPGKRALTNANAIAGMLRADQNVVMIGEIRYPQTAASVIELAQTGMSLFATLHANSALGIIRRMASLLNAAEFADPLEFLCDHTILAGLMFQRLVPVLCPSCSLPIAFVKTEEDRLHRDKVLPGYILERLPYIVDDINTVRMRGHGCAQCRQIGIVGQTVVAEVIVTDEPLLRHVRNGHYDEAYAYWLNHLKGKTFLEHAIEGVSAGRLDPYLTELCLGVPLNFTRNVAEIRKVA